MVKKGLKNRIQNVGVELEGGWNAMPKGMRKEQLTYDGSVKFPNMNGWITGRDMGFVNRQDGPIGKLPVVLIGEIPSPILTTENYVEWMTEHYPHHVNETCGLHTHVSFKSRLNYMRLMTPEFTPFIVAGLKEWAEEEKLPKDHRIWQRITKKNHDHCAHIYLGDAQVRNVEKDFHSRGKPHSRYTAINYRWANQLGKGHSVGTVECRLLPMFETADQAIRAVTKVFTLTNQFLAKMRAREPRHEAKIALSPPVRSRYRTLL